MGESAPPLSAELRRDLFRVDDPLLAGRYRDALVALGSPPPLPAVFHVDAAGWSPEVALALGDPFYLGRAALEGFAVILGVEQLGAPLVHPSLGFAAAALQGFCAAFRSEIGAIALREPLLVDVRSDAGSIAEPRALADAGAVLLRVRTPGGLVEGSLRLEEWKGEFLRSDRLWLDEGFIREMAALAARVRDLPALPEGFAASRHPLALFFSPAFGGSYVLEEPGASASEASTCVMSAELPAEAGFAPGTSARGRRVELRRLDPAGALEVLERHELVRLDLAALRSGLARVERAREWIALDALFAKDPDHAALAADDAGAAARSLHAVGAPPEILELEDLARWLRSGAGRIDAGALSPANRLRLLAPTATRASVRRFVRHLQAFLDPVDLGRAWCHAPDAFFARWVGLPSARREHFARWLATHAAALREEAA